MPITFRTAEESDWEAICNADGRAFGFFYSPEEIEDARSLHDVSRFELAFDRKEIVAIVGAYSLRVTVPGPHQLPMGGLTWVSTAATHRRQGLLTKLMARSLADIDRRGDPVAMLGASEGGIYERHGFGIASHQRVTTIDRRTAQLRPEFRPKPGAVWFVAGEAAKAHVAGVWSRYAPTRVGEIDRDDRWHDFLFRVHAKPRGEFGPSFYLAHRDGYATYRIQEQWNDGKPGHIMSVVELVAINVEAHAALWHTLLGVDLVGPITSRHVPLDDPLPYLLTNPRALQTTTLNDGVWVNVRDVAVCFSTRHYGTADRMIIEVDGERWAIDGGPDGATCKRVRTRPELITDHATLGALLLGGVRPSTLRSGRRLEARTDDVVRRADAFFLTSPAPHCQTGF